MVTKAEIIRQRNTELGRRFNLFFGDTPDTTPLQEFLVRSTGDFTPREAGQINAAINASLRGGIMTAGALRITETKVLISKKDIGSNRAVLLQESFKHHPST